MAKCEVIDLTLSDTDSDGDFIQAKEVIYPFLYQVSVVHQVYYIKFLQEFITERVCNSHMISIPTIWIG